MIISNPILCGELLYVVEIDSQLTEATIRAMKSVDKSYKVESSTLSGLKKKIRKTLIQLGAKFADEVRNTGKTKRIVVK